MQFKISILALAALVSSAVATDYYAQCDTKDNACRTAPDANMSYCSAQRGPCCDDAYKQTGCVVASPAR